jgi:condensin-2 complex subunit D3
MLSSLLLQDYIKWRGLLFHRFLVATSDSDESVAQLAEITLCGPLLTKHPKLFFNNFVESLFVLNKCTAHPIYLAAEASGDNGAGIAVGFKGIHLDGSAGRLKRLHMYQLMLSKMTDEEKIGITARLAKDVLGAAVSPENDLGRVCRQTPTLRLAFKSDIEDLGRESAYSVLSDAFAILTSPSLRVGKTSSSDDEVIDDHSTISKSEVVAAKDRLLSKISRKHLIEIVLPILSNLKAILQSSCSPLLKELMGYMTEIFRAYKVEVREFLASDPTLLQELEYDARQFKKTQR